MTAAALQATINSCFSEGYHVINQDATSAHLTRPKSFSILWSLVWLFCLGIGVLVYVFYYLGKKDEEIRLTMEGEGTPASPYTVTMLRLNSWGKPDWRSFQQEREDKRRARNWAIGIVLVLFVGLPMLCILTGVISSLFGSH